MLTTTSSTLILVIGLIQCQGLLKSQNLPAPPAARPGSSHKVVTDPVAENAILRVQNALNNANTLIEFKNHELQLDLARARRDPAAIATNTAKVARDKRAGKNIASPDEEYFAGMIRREIEEKGLNVWAQSLSGFAARVWMVHLETMKALDSLDSDTQEAKRSEIAMAKGLAMSNAFLTAIADCSQAIIDKHNAEHPTDLWAGEADVAGDGEQTPERLAKANACRDHFESRPDSAR